jgi:hypothetical protein
MWIGKYQQQPHSCSLGNSCFCMFSTIFPVSFVRPYANYYSLRLILKIYTHVSSQHYLCKYIIFCLWIRIRTVIVSENITSVKI